LILFVAVGCGEAAYQISSIGSPIEKLEEKMEEIHDNFNHEKLYV